MPAGATPWGVHSKLAEQLAQRHPQCLGDSDQGVQGDVHTTPLHFPDIFVAQIGLFRQLLLT